MFANESEPPVVRAESADGLDERGSGSAALEALRPPNSLLSISTPVPPLGLRFPAALRGGTTAGKKRTQLNRCRELQVNVCVSMRVPMCECVCVHACGFAKKTVHVCVCICIPALWVYLRVSAACICVFACALAGLCVSVCGRFVRAANT